MRKLSFLCLISLIWTFSASATDPTSRDAGFTLLQNFQCDNKGDVTQGVIDSINRTKSVVAQIGETEKSCQYVSQQIAQLPSVDSIAQGIQANSTVNAIRAQESTINEALADMSYIAALPPNDPQRSLYPDSGTLESTIQLARAQLIQLKGQLSVDQANQSKTNLISGIDQLDAIAVGYAAALRGSEDCFKKRPDIKQHLTAGIIGIAGFFLKGPLGIATSLAGRLFQDLFDINSASKNRIKDSFSAVDQTAITLGLGCAFEQMGKQHCRILREKRLFTALNGDPAQMCDATRETRNLLDKQQNLFEALKKIEEFASKTAVVAQDPSSAGLRESAKTNYRVIVSQMKQGVLSAQAAAKASQTYNGDALRSGLTNVLGQYSRMINPKASGGMGLSMENSPPGSALVQASFTSEEQRNDMLGLILKPGESASTIYSRLRDEFLKSQQDNSIAGSRAYLNSPQLNSAFSMFNSMVNLPEDRQGETTKLLISRLTDKSAPQLVLAKINDVEKTLESSLSSDLSPEQTLSYINEYFQGQDVLDASASPAESLKMLDRELQEMKKSAGPIAERSGLNKLADSVHAVAEDAKSQETTVEPISSQKKFIAELNSLVGRNREFYTQLKTVMNAQLAEKGRALVKLSRDSKNEGVALQALFLLNQETLDDTLGFSKNPSAKVAEYDGAVALSAGQIEGFSKFSEPYMDFAVKYLEGKDVRGHSLPAGVLENISPEIKNRFCIQSLSVTEIPSALMELCKGAKIRSGNLSVDFDEFSSLGQQARSCAYYNFSTQERAFQQSKVAR
jgi:hypothetical protein